MNNNIISIINISYKKIVTIIFKINEDIQNTVNIIGVGNVKCLEYIYINNIINYKKLIEYINISIKQSEIISDIKINNIFLIISDLETIIKNEKYSINFNKKIEIDYNILVNNIKNNINISNLRKDNYISHIFPSEFIIDNNKIFNPIGYKGTKLDFFVNFLTYKKKYINNFKKIFNNINIKINKIISSELCFSYYCLDNKQKEYGLYFINISLYNTTIFVFYKNIIHKIKKINIGIFLINDYISKKFEIKNEKVEILKSKINNIFINKNKIINFNININDKKINYFDINKAIKHKYIEIFNFINIEIIKIQHLLNNDNIYINNVIISGEIDNFEYIKKISEKIIKKNIIIHNNINFNLNNFNNYLNYIDSKSSIGLINYIIFLYKIKKL